MALARALAVEPRVLLLDEPFGALDARVRDELRTWLRNLHDQVRVTTLFVTHDQQEAFEVSDQVVVLSGKDKGRRGAVLQVFPDGRVLVEGVNVAKKHTKPNPQANKQGGIIEKTLPLNISKIAIWNPGEKTADRIGFKTLTDGRKVRFFKSNGEMIDA